MLYPTHWNVQFAVDQQSAHVTLLELSGPQKHSVHSHSGFAEWSFVPHRRSLAEQGAESTLWDPQDRLGTPLLWIQHQLKYKISKHLCRFELTNSSNKNKFDFHVSPPLNILETNMCTDHSQLGYTLHNYMAVIKQEMWWKFLIIFKLH